MGLKKTLAMITVGLSTAFGGQAKAEPNPEPTPTKPTVEHRAQTIKVQSPSFISYPDFFPLNKKGEFDTAKSFEMMQKIPVEDLKQAFQEYSERMSLSARRVPGAANKLLDVLSQGNPEVKKFLKTLQDEVDIPEMKLLTKEEGEKRDKKESIANTVQDSSLILTTIAGLSFLIVGTLAANATLPKKEVAFLKTAAIFGGVGVLSMISALAATCYKYSLENEKTPQEVRQALVQTHKQFFEAYRSNQINLKMAGKGVPITGNKNEDDNTIVTLTMGELKTLIGKSGNDVHFRMAAKEKLGQLSK